MCKLRDDTMSQAGELPEGLKMEDREMFNVPKDLSGAAVRGEAVAEGWTVIQVNNGFGALMCALDRASRKGYLPDALTEEWEAFDFVNTPVSARAADAPSEPSEPAMRAVLLNAKAVIQRWDSPLWRQEVGTAEWINQLRKSVELAESRAADALDSQPTDSASIGDDAKFLRLIYEWSNASGDIRSKASKALTAYLDSKILAPAAPVLPDENIIRRYNWIRIPANHFWLMGRARWSTAAEFDAVIDSSIEAIKAARIDAAPQQEGSEAGNG